MKPLLIIFILLLLSTSPLKAQATLTLTGPANVTPGATATLSATLSGVTGTQFTAFQMSLTLPPGITLGTVTASPAGIAVGKGSYCGPAICLELGMTNATPPVLSNNPMVDGQALSLQLVVSPTATAGVVAIPLVNLLGASVAGEPIPLVSGPVYSLRVLSKCDVNQDGLIDFRDVQAMVGVLDNGGTCPLSGGCTVAALVVVLVAALGGACTL
jgi:hypothetical protein